jgi:hypothetical protein
VPQPAPSPLQRQAYPPPPPHAYPPPQHFAAPRPVAPPPPRRKSNTGWWLAGIGLVLLLVVGGCTMLYVIGSESNGNNGPDTDVTDVTEVDEFAELRDACAGGDMVACDDLFLLSPEGSADEAFGGTCGNRTDGSFAGFCTENRGEFAP